MRARIKRIITFAFGFPPPLSFSVKKGHKKGRQNKPPSSLKQSKIKNEVD
ncbi:hypothetical protein GCM10007971_25530 [Oceanobacillus indicireducens]|uniref:Uncharacterized protein n=1 Tax=Oceanobacillus indicireducens TaxID=1004261 RepID=A0A918D390_9BACI|nr:hypothetical protein GCM10007971_25530 [Oceanobacillus indicireducens]